MGFAVGTTSDDIRQALTATPDITSKDDAISSTIEAAICELISIGPKVMAKLTFPNKAAAEQVVRAWNSVEVDGGELAVWVTDDKFASPTSADAFKSFSSLTKSFGVPGFGSNATPGSIASFFSNGNLSANGASAPATPLFLWVQADRRSSQYHNCHGWLLAVVSRATLRMAQIPRVALVRILLLSTPSARRFLLEISLTSSSQSRQRTRIKIHLTRSFDLRTTT